MRENLLLAEPAAKEATLIQACKLAQAWDFIQGMPDKLETRLGSGGVMLSSGQMQRISLAQAFVKDAPILILDEATSALDPQTEQGLVESIEQIRQQRTVIVISHRMSTIHYADKLLYLNQQGESRLVVAGRLRQHAQTLVYSELLRVNPAGSL